MCLSRMLAGPEVKLSIVVQLRAGFCFGRRLCSDLLRRIVAESGEIFSMRRVFVGGILAGDVVTPIPGSRSPATVEMTLLREIEG